MEKIPIGTITKPHGIKGALRVKTDSDFKEERYKKGNTLYIQHKNQFETVTVDGFFTKGSLDVVSFEGFNDIAQVEKYRSNTLFIDSDNREPLEEDAYYYNDLIGLNAYVSGEKIGVVIEVKDMPQSALLRIETEEGTVKPVPFMKIFIESVDMESRSIYIREVEGLL